MTLKMLRELPNISRIELANYLDISTSTLSCFLSRQYPDLSASKLPPIIQLECFIQARRLFVIRSGEHFSSCKSMKEMNALRQEWYGINKRLNDDILITTFSKVRNRNRKWLANKLKFSESQLRKRLAAMDLEIPSKQLSPITQIEIFIRLLRLHPQCQSFLEMKRFHDLFYSETSQFSYLEI